MTHDFSFHQKFQPTEHGQALELFWLTKFNINAHLF